MPFDTSRAYPQYDQSTFPVSYDKVLDHFRYDAEAYTSGAHPRTNLGTMRSRSPTPFGDDEDYKLCGNNIIHYTGHSHSNGHIYDPENVTHRDSRGEYDISQYADISREDYEDDGEKTPISLEPDVHMETRHFGPAPIGRARRRLKKKRVQLTNGHLVVDLSVPPKLVLPYRGEPEMIKTRYTAVTCDPDDFEAEKYFLRQNESGRTTELFIVITMYNVSPSRGSTLQGRKCHLYRKTRCYFAERCMVSCATLHIYVHASILKHGVQMHGRRYVHLADLSPLNVRAVYRLSSAS